MSSLGNERDEFGEEIVIDDAELTPFQNVDVEADSAKDGMAPSGESPTDSESADIKKQVAEITAANELRAPGEKVSVSPGEVS